jgi:acetyltransferase-like isoleucine patch superfamily enzyme
MSGRRLSWDWWPGELPANVELPDDAYAETAYSFLLSRSEEPVAVRYGRGSSTYLGTMFDLGPRGRVSLGTCTLVHGAWFIADGAIPVGDHTMISWNVVIMDTYRVPVDPAARRAILERLPFQDVRRPDAGGPPAPVSIGRLAWIGFNACILPGTTIGDGAIVGAGSVVQGGVPPYAVVAGNPARIVRRLDPGEARP